ncbi:response regulator [Desulfomicrobium escambiense]|uniref:response regulator n=1 Tax=Desulfomicrobium escambiense TaxID=29503 RepID=UPI00041A5554|nr:response regulator [Desulfomicrobium escambiense]
MKKISISARLILVMSLIAVLTAGLSAYLILRFIESGEQVKVLAEEGTQGIVWGEKANFHLHNLIINFYRANSGDMKWVTAMEENIPRVRSALDEYAKTARDPENRRMLAETREALDIYAGDILILGQSFRKGVFGPGIIQVLNDLDTKTHANRLITAITNLVEYSKALAEKNRASFFADMSANTRASIVLACVVILILIWAGYMGVIWTRDEIAEHNAKERLLQKLRTDLLNSLEAAGAVSRHIAFDSGALTFVGEVEKVLGLRGDAVSNFVEYARQIHPDDRDRVLGEIPVDNIGGWDEFIGLLQDDFIEVDGKRLLKKDSRLVRSWIEQAGSDTATNHREFRCRSATGDDRQWRWKRSLFKLLPHPSGLGYSGESGIVFDITDEYEMRNALIRAKYDAEAANRAKSDFLARMSHEIRTPMNAIIGMTHLILRTEVNEAQKDYLSKILSSARVLMGIINDILDYSKIEADRMQLEDLPFRLDDVFKSLADVILVKAQEKQLEVIFAVSDDTPQWLVGDALRLGQVLINLAGNAVKFTPDGEILVNVGVMERSEHAVQLHFSVTDSGIGLTAEQIQGLFQPFTQADGTITRRFGGTGLGLAISKSLVEAMDGSIWVESQPDKGSTFHFTARLGLAPDQPTQLFLPLDLRCLKTLVIDDNSTARSSFADMLKALFATPPVTATSADEALDTLLAPDATGIPYDLIFVDWRMPGKDGIETARLIKDRIRETGSSTSLVLMANGYELETARPSAQLAGVDAFLAKPACPSDIFDTVATLCGRKTEPGKGSHIVVSMGKLDRVRGTRILLVDDNLFNQQVAGELLEQAGMVVEIASNGFSALEMAAANDYDLIFMDIQMPDLDGLEVTRRIRQMHEAAHLPIVAMTAHALAEDRAKSLAAGMNDHITKPIDPEELLAQVVKWGNPERGAHAPAPAPQIGPGMSGEPDTVFRFAEIDHQAGLGRCLGNTESYLRLLRLFHQEYSRFARQCEEHGTRGECEQIRHLAHAIKGPAGSIGARKLQAAADDLEQALGAKDATPDNRLLLSFRQALEAVMRDLDPILRQAESGAPAAAPCVFAGDGDTSRKLLERLRSCLEKNDAEASAVLPEFGAVNAWPELADDWAQLKAHIGNFDFEQALEPLNRIEAWLQARKNVDDEH